MRVGGTRGTVDQVSAGRWHASQALQSSAEKRPPDAARGFDQFAALHGAEQAIKILSSESVVLDR